MTDIEELNALIAAGLGEIPQTLITPEQRAAALRGEQVVPTWLGGM